MAMQLAGNKISRVWEGKHRDVRRIVTTGNVIHPVRRQVRIIRLRGPKPGLQGLPIVTHPRNTMSFDGKRVERIRGLPCRDNIGEFATLEGRLEKKKKGAKKEVKPKSEKCPRRTQNRKTKRNKYKSVLINETSPPHKQKTYNQMEQSKNRGRNNYCPPGGGIRGRGRDCG